MSSLLIKIYPLRTVYRYTKDYKKIKKKKRIIKKEAGERLPLYVSKSWSHLLRLT